MPAKRVLSVGQCYADHLSISSTLQRHFGAEVVSADSSAVALEQLRQGGFDLVLVNRVFDADGASGLDFIKRVRAEAGSRPPPVMLVSNYEDAQKDAIAAGAVPGFGKAALGQPAMLGRVRAVLGERGGDF
jgi:two-component system chemotaxis response regulator CheY